MTETTNRNYNINEFDWDGKDEVEHDQGVVEECEKLVRQALAAVTPVEDSWLKPSAVDNDRARITYNVPYSLTTAQKDHMASLTGDVRTLTYNAREYHDHPISHCLTEISEDLVVRKFGNEPFVSIWGNAARHRRMGHVNSKVVGSRIVPHDWFRNRGCEENSTDISAFVERRGHLQYRLFLNTHGLYYTSLEDVACWLGGNPDAEYHAVIHRHNKSMGRLNMGELEYTVDSNGMVSQTNPLTGMTYKHRSLEPLFHTDSCRLFDGRIGLAWDINQLAGDNYLVKFVLCDPARANNVQSPWELIKKDRSVTLRGDVAVYRCLGFEWYVYNGAEGEVVLKDVELFDRLRRTIAGKERSSRNKADLMTMCRRLANKNDIISIHQGFAHEIPPELMADYVNAAFYADVRHELEVALLYHRQNRDAVETLNAFITGGHVPVDFSILGAVGRAVSAPFSKLSGLITDQSLIGDIYSEPPPPRIASYLPEDPFKRKQLSSASYVDALVKRLREPEVIP